MKLQLPNFLKREPKLPRRTEVFTGMWQEIEQEPGLLNKPNIRKSEKVFLEIIYATTANPVQYTEWYTTEATRTDVFSLHVSNASHSKNLFRDSDQIDADTRISIIKITPVRRVTFI